MSYFCPVCEVAWWPYQAMKGVCPECGKGTKFVQEPGDVDADVRFKAAMDKRRAQDAAKAREMAFELHADEWEAYRWDAQLEEFGALPVTEPRRDWAA